MDTRLHMKTVMYVTEYTPTFPMPYLVRIVGFGARLLDKQPTSQTGDAFGYGHTEEDAFGKALRMRAAQERAQKEQLRLPCCMEA